jgi:hypothetical protein
MDELEMRMEDTPNPNAKRYVCNRTVQEGSKGRFFTEASAGGEPLVDLLFEIEGVSGVMLLPNSITLNKEAAAEWDGLTARAEDAIRRYLLS